jgi:hypothetical protein
VQFVLFLSDNTRSSPIKEFSKGQVNEFEANLAQYRSRAGKRRCLKARKQMILEVAAFGKGAI